MNQKFYELPEEKQNRIINSGYKVFASYDYKKAPMSSIAEEAIISKSLLFHYFENKKCLYLYLFKTAVALLQMKIHKEVFEKSNDFFELVLFAIQKRIQTMQKYPYIYQFIGQAYYEQNPIIEHDISDLKSQMIQMNKDKLLSLVDASKLKNPKDIGSLYDIVIWLSEGYMARNMKNLFLEKDRIIKDAKEMLAALKRNFYKDEYQ